MLWLAVVLTRLLTEHLIGGKLAEDIVHFRLGPQVRGRRRLQLSWRPESRHVGLLKPSDRGRFHNPQLTARIGADVCLNLAHAGGGGMRGTTDGEALPRFAASRTTKRPCKEDVPRPAAEIGCLLEW